MKFQIKYKKKYVINAELIRFVLKNTCSNNLLNNDVRSKN